MIFSIVEHWRYNIMSSMVTLDQTTSRTTNKSTFVLADNLPFSNNFHCNGSNDWLTKGNGHWHAHDPILNSRVFDLR